MREELSILRRKDIANISEAIVHANRLAVDSAARPIRMVAENVRVEVGEGVSRVNGDYVFRQGGDDWPAMPCERERAR